MTNLTIEVDVYNEIVPNGIETNIFIGEADAPNITKITSFTEMIDMFIEWNSCCGEIPVGNKVEIGLMIDYFEEAHKYAVKAARKAGYEE